MLRELLVRRVRRPVVRLAMVAASAALGACAVTTPAPGPVRVECIERHMGVQARIVAWAPDESHGQAAVRAAMDEVARLDSIMSDWIGDSELMRLCRAPVGVWTPISADLHDVLGKGLDVARRTDGAFDPTVGPVVVLWREARRSGQLPDPDALRTAVESVGWTALEIRPGQARLTRPGMRLDLGGIGKGYAADRAIAKLASRGIRRALVDMGGDITVSGPPPGRSAWRIEIRGRQSEPIVLHLTDASVATSGDVNQFVEVGGARYSHIVDPRTSLGLTTPSVVTVVAPDGATADALASAMSVLGPSRETARLIASSPGLSARIETLTEDGILDSRVYGPFPAGD